MTACRRIVYGQCQCKVRVIKSSSSGKLMSCLKIENGEGFGLIKCEGVCKKKLIKLTQTFLV